MNTRGKSGPVRIGKLIGPVLKQAERGQRRPEALGAVSSWSGTVGPKIAKVSRAVRLTDGKLFVEVKAPAWKQELLLKKRNILKKINQRLGKNIVSDMVINVRDFINVQGK
ncbi:MAG: DUF721 domain-containing protein [Deltaproteobacteria bacterium]|nr:DUF721 domain-containing protein [Deltaproteobacteria bacterium]